MSPLISVVMPAYNTAEYLREAMDSILNQTVRDFEFIIIDDASMDDTPAVLNSYDDPRIRVIRNEKNLGVAGTLNVGLEAATGIYIARMDADDICVLDRFERQIASLEAHPEVGCLSSNMISIDPQGNFLFNKRPYYGGGASAAVCRWELFWLSPLPHNVVTMRRDLMEKHHFRYDLELNTAEDHDLWCRMARVTQLVRAPEVLVYRRLADSNVSSVLREKQLATHLKITKRELELFWEKPIAAEAIETLLKVISRGEIKQAHIPAATRLLTETWQRYEQVNTLTAEERDIIRRWVTDQLLRLARSARGKNVIPPLLALRKAAPREVFSRNGIRLVMGVFKR